MLPGAHHSSEFLWRVSDIVQQHRVSDRTVRRMIAAGTLRVVRPPGLRIVRIPDSEIRRLFHSRPARPAAGGT
jgi:excisionase family DNA binding protein